LVDELRWRKGKLRGNKQDIENKRRLVNPLRITRNRKNKNTIKTFLGALSDGGDKKKCSPLNFQEQRTHKFKH
jgi:hypothetical protein